MIEDIAFFGFSRTGNINGKKYPAMINSLSEIKNDGDSLSLLGEKIDKKFVYPYEIEQQIIETPSFVMIPNGSELIRKPRRFARIIMSAIQKYGYSRLIYVSGISDPYIIPVLVYMGVSIFDDISLRIESSAGYMYTPIGIKKTEKDQTENNLNYVNELLMLLSESIENGTLRDIVEKNGVSSKALELLRLSDYSYFMEYDQVFPSRTPYIKANAIEDIYRPDLVRYRNRIMEAYKKPDIPVALLLPCSAKKPYSESKTHRRIIEGISDLRKYIHEIIITSPLGVVPRDLEEAYPPRFYDIPVIGLWYEDEKTMMKQTLLSYMKHNPYRKVIGFVPEDLNFISEAVPYDYEYVPFSFKNIDILREKIMNSIDREKRIDLRKAKYDSMLSYQFGEWIMKYVSGYAIRHNYNQDMIVKDSKILFVYNDRMGKFTINKNSAAFFLENGKFTVEIDDFKPTSYVYAVGVKGSTEDIRQEDEVVLAHDGEVRGVGIAKMPSTAMVALKKGIAVKVR